MIELRLHYKRVSDTENRIIETGLLWHRIEHLQPNTQYEFYAIAVSNRNHDISFPSERTFVWTEPALAAIVDVSSCIVNVSYLFMILSRSFLFTYRHQIIYYPVFILCSGHMQLNCKCRFLVVAFRPLLH